MRRLSMRTLPVAGVLACVAAVLVPGTALAEVGVTAGSGAQDPIVPYIVVDVIDEPDPFSGRWRRVFPQGGAHVALNTDGADRGDGRPELAVHPTTRVAFAVWSRNGAAGRDIVVSRFEAGAWSAAEVVVDLPEDVHDPRIVIDPGTGDVHLVYWVDAATPRVEHRTAPADLATWSDATVVSAAEEAACRPHGVFHEGVLRVAYEVHVAGPGGTPRLIVLSRLAGATFEPEVVATTTYAGEVRVEVHSHAGRMWIDWVDADGEMAWTRRDSGLGTWEPVRLESFGSVLERDFHVRGAIRSQAME